MQCSISMPGLLQHLLGSAHLQHGQCGTLVEDGSQGLVLPAKADAYEPIPLLEVDSWGWTPGLYPHHTAVDLGRWPEIVPAHLCGKRFDHRQAKVTSGLNTMNVTAQNTRRCAQGLTLSRWDTRARSWVLTASLQYRLSPGLATRRMANSCWNMMTAARNAGR